MGSWEKNIRQITPYVPGEQPDFSDMIKLNTNENPYPPAPSVEKQMNAMKGMSLRLYPKPDAKALVTALSEQYKINENRIFVGVGSDDVLGMIFLTCFCSEKPILFPDISYSFYDVWATLFKIPYKTIPVDADFRIHPKDYRMENGGIVIANPNAPTSLALSAAEVEDIVKHNPDSVVVIDEAYVDFGGETAFPLLDRYENLLVVQTFSKSRSLAGLRVGYAFGSERLISAIFAVRNSYNSYTMNYPAITCGAAALKEQEYYDECTKKIIATRERAAEELSRMGFLVPESKTNFLFVEHRSVPAEEIFEKLREQHIYVRYFKKPLLQNRLRITIGTDAEMDRLFEALRKIIP